MKKIRRSNDLKWVKCVVCFDLHVKSEGFVCPRICGTFTCWDCLLQSYKMAAKPGAIQGQSNAVGELLCSNNACKCPLDVVTLAKSNASAAILKAQETFKLNIVASKQVAEALRQQEHNIKAEYARIEQIEDVDEKAAVKLRQKIVEEALTLRCPRCKIAFLDFDGCFAVNCGNNSCGCGFCAWCLKDCGNDAHRHVLMCSQNPRKGKDCYNTWDAFTQHHKKKRAIQVLQMLLQADLSPRATQKLQQLMKRDLEDLQINPSDIFPEQPILPALRDFAPTQTDKPPHPGRIKSPPNAVPQPDVYCEYLGRHPLQRRQQRDQRDQQQQQQCEWCNWRRWIACNTRRICVGVAFCLLVITLKCGTD